MTPPEPASFGEVVAFLVGLGVIVAGLRWLVPIVRGLVRTVVAFTRAQVAFLESWHGTPIRHDASGAVVEEAHPGIMARLLGYDGKIEGMTVGLAAVRDGQDDHGAKLAEVLERVAAHDAQIAQIAYETKPNGGGSAHDKLTRQLAANANSLEALRGMVAGTLQELGEFRGEYERALRTNHPGYDPDRYSD